MRTIAQEFKEQTADILTRARVLVLSGWVQRKEAQDEQGLLCDPNNPRACSYCVSGAVSRAAFDQAREGSATAGYYARRALYGQIEETLRFHEGLVHWNDRDGRTLEEVVDLIDRSLSTLKEES